jgi:transposase
MSWMLFQVYHEISENADYGDVVAYDAIIQSLKLEQSFDRHTYKRPLGHRLGRLLRLHLNNYCTDRTSKNMLGEWYADQPALQERLRLKPAELGHQDAYRPLDYLDTTAQAAILNDCLVVLVTEFGLDLSLLYEDASSSYFEGEKCALGGKGYSRDHRPDRPQVNYDVGILPGGFPARTGVYAGNVPDNRVIDQISDEWAAQHPDARTVLVLDRGMSLWRNRVRIIGNGQGYVAGVKIDGAIRTLVLSIPNDEFTEEVPLADGKEPLKVVRRAGTVRVRGQDVPVMNHIYFNPAEAKREQQRREQRIARARAAVAEVQAQVNAGHLKKVSVVRRGAKKKLKKHKVHALFAVKFDPEQRRIILEPREDVLAERALLDGKFVLQTTEMAWTSEKCLTTYRQHDEAEKVIQMLKQIVPVRPIRHWNERRVAAHIFLSILACLVMAVLRHLARQIGLKGGIETLRHLLQRVKRVVSHVHLGELVIPQVSLTGLTEDARRLLEHIGVPLPKPAGATWVAVRLDAEKGAQMALALV